MLTRILSALVGIVFGVGVILLDNLWLYIGVLSIIGAIGVWELTKAVKCEKHKPMRWYCIIVSALVPSVLCSDLFRPFASVLFVAFIIVLFVFLLAGHKKIRFEEMAMCGAAAIFIPFALSCIILIRYSSDNSLLGVSLIFYTLFCAWFGDSGAYFVGTFLGKHKLCPEISPKKTVEGLIGGIVTVGVVCLIHCLIFNLLISDGAYMSYAVLIAVGMAASGIGVLGDLSASVIKRQFDVKDFGNIMPGHGGVLDRFDSVLFVAPFLYIVFNFLDHTM